MGLISKENGKPDEKTIAKFEEDVFWMFLHISHTMNYRVIYKANFPKLTGMVKNLEERIKMKTPEIYQHIKENDVKISLIYRY